MRFRVAIAVAGVCFTAFASASRVRAQEAETIRLTAKPAAVFADGVTTTTITAEVRDRSGGLVPNGQYIRFSTTLGTIETATQTQGGQGSVKLIASNLPGRATVTASAGHATADVIVEFTSKRVVLENASRAVSIRAKYLLYNDYEQTVDAAEEVHIRIGRLQITADRAQVFLERSTLVAESKPGAAKLIITDGATQFAVDRFQYSWEASRGMASGLTQPLHGLYDYDGLLAEMKTAVGPPPAHEFEFADLVPSPLSVKAARVLYLPGSELQFTRARILLNGKQRIALPYHVIPLGSSRSGYAQYIGLGSRGPLLDIPYYIAAGAIGTSQLRLKYNAPEGLYGATVAGWAVDLLGKYDFRGRTMGAVALTRLTSPDWGLSWTHDQDMGPGTRGFFNVDTRSGFGAFQRYSLANISISRQAKEYSSTLTAFASHALQTTGDVDATVQSSPKPLAAGFAWSVGGSVGRHWLATLATETDPSTVVASDSAGVNGRIIAPTLHLRDGTVVGASVGQGMSLGRGASRRSTLGTITAARRLGVRGSANLVYNYSDYGYSTSDTVFTVRPERQTLTASFGYAKMPTWAISTYATIGIEQQSRNVRLSGQYYFSKVWAATLNAGVFELGSASQNPALQSFRAVNVEAKLTRIVGERSLSLVYSTFHHKVYLDYVPGKFY